MTWRVPRLWEGGECWILGGGPSLPGQFGVPKGVIKKVLSRELPLSAYSPYMSAIHGKHVIGVNVAYKIGDWIDMVFWGDKRWYLTNRLELAKFKGLKVTCHPYFNTPQSKAENIKHVAKDNNKPKGISDRSNSASWNSNSGSAAISVAANMGVTSIVLVGFDMKLGEDDWQHCHSEYSPTGRKGINDVKKLPFHRHMNGFPFIARDAYTRGITIINASPDSAIACLPKMTVQDVLDGKPVVPVPIPPMQRRNPNERRRR